MTNYLIIIYFVSPDNVQDDSYTHLAYWKIWHIFSCIKKPGCHHGLSKIFCLFHHFDHELYLGLVKSKGFV